MPQTLWAVRNGEFLPAEQLCVPISDSGFVQGLTVAEQMRTFGGRLFRLEEHLRRLRRSLAIVGVDLPPAVDAGLQRDAEELVRRNAASLEDGDDLGLSLWVTPGPYATLAAGAESGPLAAMHTYPLPFAQWVDRYRQGQPLVVTKVRQVPAECWPPELKCRSRMHYYLADREAAAAEPGSRALLLDLQGRVLEASTANLVVYRRSEGLVSPPREAILPGVSVAVVEELAGKVGAAFLHRELSVDDVATADEVLLSSTSMCLLPVVRLNGAPIGAGRPGSLFERLLAAWSDLVGLDVESQARKFRTRPPSPRGPV